jgi:N-acetylmuramoyl-L-alanine amidase
MLKRTALALQVCFFLFWLGAPLTLAFAESKVVDRRFEEIKSAYFKLRNTDHAVQQENAWRKVASDFETYERQGDGPHSVTAMFHAAAVYEHLYAVSQEQRDAKEALRLLDSLTKKYAQSELADDALLRSGNLLAQLGNTDKAVSQLKLIVTKYQSADQFAVAQRRLKELQGEDKPIDRGISPAQLTEPSAGTLRVLIDPGHGGDDLGGEGPGGLIEKDIVLDIAKRLELKLTLLGIAARRTRVGDEFVPLAQRTEIANAWGADLFLSLHTNASEKGDLSGFQVFYLDAEGDASAKLLAERENNSIKFEEQSESGDVAFMLSELIQNAKLAESRRFAEILSVALLPLAPKNKGKVVPRAVAKAPFYVLVGAHMPCALAELLFIDNPQDAALLAKAEYRDAIAKTLAKGVLEYWRERNQSGSKNQARNKLLK